MGIQERKEREKAHMRQMILETALAIFQAEGFDKVSVRAIADRIEYSPATLYLYFKNKDDIFYALHEEGFRRFIEYQKRADVLDDPAQRLKRMGQDYLNFAVENPEYYDLMFIMAAPMREVSQEWSCGKEAFENLVKAVQDCLESGQILSGNVHTVSLGIWAFVHGLASLLLRGRLQIIPEEQREKAIEAALEYLDALLTHRPGR